jgi:3-phosphoglycerate kinase
MNGKRVLVRVDFNVPLDENRNVTDDRRIRMALPTIKCALDAGARLVLMSHLGRPKGGPESAFSLKPAAERLAALLERPVQFAPDSVGPEVEKRVQALKPGEVLVLENVRFHKGEEKNDEKYAAQLARLADLYVNDAFGSAHRKHASTYGVPARMPKGARAIGFLMEKELKFLGEALQDPARPFVAVLGGAKVSDKVAVIENLLRKVDRLLIGGAMAYVFMAARGQQTGKSLVEKEVEKKDGTKVDILAKARDLLGMIEASKVQVLFPEDHLVAKEVAADAETDVQGPEIEKGWIGVDLGPATTQAYVEGLQGAATALWNGPMGIFEMAPFAEGTKAICQAVAKVGEGGGTAIVGGGDTAAAVEKFGLAQGMTHLSTGGGASLEFLEGKPFDTIEILDEA